MANKTKVGFISLGCSKNLCDTEIMLKHLLDAGYEITPEETEADIVIVNTCAFIESGIRAPETNATINPNIKNLHTLLFILIFNVLLKSSHKIKYKRFRGCILLV